MSTIANAEMDSHIKDIMHKETNSELVMKREQLATNYETREPRRSSRRRISNKRLRDLA